MFDIKKLYTTVFTTIIHDDEMLSLLEIPKDGVDINDFLKQCRSQIIDSATPDDLLSNYNTRISIFEEQSTRPNMSKIETGYIRLDIHITQDKNKIDRRVLKIVKRLIEILDTDERKRAGLKQLTSCGLDGLHSRHRKPAENTTYTGWEKYSLVFEYQYIT